MIKNNTTWSFRAQDVRGTSDLRRPEWNVDSGAVPTDRRTAERRIMQVGSSINSGYYTPYQTNKSEKYPAGFNKTEEGNMTFNEETENPGFAPNVSKKFARLSFGNLKSSGKEQVVFAGAIGSANQYFKYADEAGIIDYNGIIFYCDTETDTLMLGDCSNVSKCIRISLTDGGFLMVNRDNRDQLFDALPFFSPEDMIKILQVLQQEKMAEDSIVGMEQEEDKILEMAEGEKQIKRSLEEVPNYSEYLKKKIKANVSAIDDGALLTAETTSCKYETANPDDDDIIYVTFYTTDGIRCKKLGSEDFEWTLTFKNEEQYNKVMEFLGNFPSDWNMRFAAHKNFWQDFLNDEIDIDAFMEFMNGTNKGVPDYSITVGDSMYIDTEKISGWSIIYGKRNGRTAI